MVLTQATAFFDEKLDQLEGQCKDQVKSLFETFRETLIHVFDKDRENFYEFEHRQSADIDQLDDHDPFDHRNSTSNRKGPRKDKQGGKGVTTPKKGKSRGNHRVSGAVNKRQHNSHLSAEQDDDKSGGEGGGGAESSDGSPRTDKKSGGGEKSPQFNSAIVTVPGEDGVTEEIDAPSIVTEDGDNFEDGGGNSRENRAKSIEPRKTPDHHEAHQFQEKCWNDFIKSDSGSQVLDQFSQKQDAVRKILTDHDEAQQNLAIGMGKLTHLQLQLDILEQDRKFKGRLLDEHGIPMIITSPQEQQVRLEIQGVLKTEQELMTKLKEIRVSIEECKCRLDAAKREVEHVFQAFCMDAHGKHADLTHLPLSTLTHGVTTTLNRWSRVHRVKSVPKPDADHEPALSDDMLGANEKDIAMAREFEYLKRLARQQVETLMAAYPKRPPWVSYY
ncbi:uncharacterized protein LOC118433060 [Folsomia candida]|nr:uncharacterized protein LOC118433060 [Folsomia candida]